MPTLYEDFLNPAFFEALANSVGYGLIVLLVLSGIGGGFAMLTGGTQPRKWGEHKH